MGRGWVDCPILPQIGAFSGIYNLKPTSFIPLLAELGIQLGQFEEEERGGLILDEDQNVLRLLARNGYR